MSWSGKGNGNGNGPGPRPLPPLYTGRSFHSTHPGSPLNDNYHPQPPSGPASMMSKKRPPPRRDPSPPHKRVNNHISSKDSSPRSPKATNGTTRPSSDVPLGQRVLTDVARKGSLDMRSPSSGGSTPLHTAVPSAGLSTSAMQSPSTTTPGRYSPTVNGGTTLPVEARQARASGHTVETKSLGVRSLSTLRAKRTQQPRVSADQVHNPVSIPDKSGKDPVLTAQIAALKIEMDRIRRERAAQDDELTKQAAKIKQLQEAATPMTESMKAELDNIIKSKLSTVVEEQVRKLLDSKLRETIHDNVRTELTEFRQGNSTLGNKVRESVNILTELKGRVKRVEEQCATIPAGHEQYQKILDSMKQQIASIDTLSKDQKATKARIAQLETRGPKDDHVKNIQAEMETYQQRLAALEAASELSNALKETQDSLQSNIENIQKQADSVQQRLGAVEAASKSDNTTVEPTSERLEKSENEIREIKVKLEGVDNVHQGLSLFVSQLITDEVKELRQELQTVKDTFANQQSSGQQTASISSTELEELQVKVAQLGAITTQLSGSPTHQEFEKLKAELEVAKADVAQCKNEQQNAAPMVQQVPGIIADVQAKLQALRDQREVDHVAFSSLQQQYNNISTQDIYAAMVNYMQQTYPAAPGFLNMIQTTKADMESRMAGCQQNLSDLQDKVNTEQSERILAREALEGRLAALEKLKTDVEEILSFKDEIKTACDTVPLFQARIGKIQNIIEDINNNSAEPLRLNFDPMADMDTN